MIVREFWHIDQYKSEIREREYDENQTGLQIIRSAYSLVSAGTERLIAKGAISESMKEAMKVPFMQGSFDYPLTYGYSLVGKVIGGKDSLIGKTVHLMYPHQDYVFVPEECLTIVPDAVPLQRAVLASNLETAVNVIWDSEISMGERILICGFGLIGALIAILAVQMPATQVFIHEINPARRNTAIAMGFKLFEFENKSVELFDKAINTTASADALQLCIDATLPNSKIIEASWYGSNPVCVRLGGTFHTGQKQIISSQVSKIPQNRQAHFDFVRRKQLVFDLLWSNIFDLLPLQQVDFMQLPEVFGRLRNGSYQHFATIVKY